MKALAQRADALKIRVWFLQETIDFFCYENHLRIFLGVNIFHIGCHCRIQNCFRGFMVSRIENQLLICLHHSQSQKMPSNAMARAASATAGIIFFWEAPRRRGL